MAKRTKEQAERDRQRNRLARKAKTELRKIQKARAAKARKTKAAQHEAKNQTKATLKNYQQVRQGIQWPDDDDEPSLIKQRL